MSADGPLVGLRVVDFTQFVSGPLCTMMLADLGADVVKVESPDLPDPMRSTGATPDGSGSPLSFHTLNRSKRSVAANLKDPDDLASVRALVDRADVLVENFRPGVAERLGIGYGAVSATNPRLVYASLSGFGDVGPLVGLGGYDILAQATSGIMSVTGNPDEEPLKAGVPVTDVAAGLVLAFGIVTALRARDRDCVGQKVSTSLLAAGLTFGVWEASEYWSTGRVPGRLGNIHRSLAPYQVLRAADGTSFVIAANSDRAFIAAVEALGRGGLRDDARFATNDARLRHRPELVKALESITCGAPATTWVERLNRAGVPACEVLDYGEVLDHAQVAAIGMAATVSADASANGDDGPIRVLGNPLRMSATPPTYRSPGPSLGSVDPDLVWVEDRA